MKTLEYGPIEEAWSKPRNVAQSKEPGEDLRMWPDLQQGQRDIVLSWSHQIVTYSKTRLQNLSSV